MRTEAQQEESSSSSFDNVVGVVQDCENERNDDTGPGNSTLIPAQRGYFLKRKSENVCNVKLECGENHDRSLNFLFYLSFSTFRHLVLAIFSSTHSSQGFSVLCCPSIVEHPEMDLSIFTDFKPYLHPPPSTPPPGKFING